jgi:Domain of unknown function (DUF5666)
MIKLRRGRTLQLALLLAAVASLSSAAVALANGRGHALPHGRGHGVFHHYGASGWVTASPNVTTLSVRDARGTVHSFAVNSSTKYVYADRSAATAANATPGRVVTVSATRPTTSGANPVAQRVVIALAQVGGEVTSNTAGVLTVADNQGFTRTIDTSSSTTCKKGRSTVACGSIAAGTVIEAVGKVAANGTTLDATRVSSAR